MNIFVTGTDTECGKTFVSASLLEMAAGRGQRAAGMKPVATGTTTENGQRLNEDVESLRRASNVELPASSQNPYLFDPPTSPNIAALNAATTIDLAVIASAYRDCANRADLVIVEGVGGWCVPLAPGVDVGDLAATLDLPVLLVVGIKLGCINHARLSQMAILASGVNYLGWVANDISTDLFQPETVLDTLITTLGRKPLGTCGRDDPGGLAALVDAIVPGASDRG